MATGLGGMALFVRSIRRPSSTNSEVKSTFSLLPLSVLVSLATFIFLFEKVGYFVSAPVLIAALMLIYGNRSPLIVLTTTAVSSISLYVMFVYGLNLYLGG
ncbi:tripartite tricarboxylate transporter TctB family protein [Vibrio sp. SCSIO 43132]|nr:tripartite tricarboxylate transporter TctB family protein [Vibrio sp. SCSIO 43132]